MQHSIRVFWVAIGFALAAGGTAAAAGAVEPETNPAPQAGAPAQVWSLELTSPGNLTRMGWSRKSFSPGDHIEVAFNPLRDGKHGGAFKEAKLASGQVLSSSVRDVEKPGLK